MADLSKDEIQARIDDLAHFLWAVEAELEKPEPDYDFIRLNVESAHKMGADVVTGAGYEIPTPREGAILPLSGGGGK